MIGQLGGRSSGLRLQFVDERHLDDAFDRRIAARNIGEGLIRSAPARLERELYRVKPSAGLRWWFRRLALHR